MQPGLIFAFLAAIAFGFWTVFHQLAAKYINNLFGAILVSFTAVILGLILFVPQARNMTLYTNPKGIIFAVLAGLMALGIDYFALKAYSSGLQVSIVGPLIIGGSIGVAATTGFLLGDSITLAKIIGLVLIIAGSALLAANASA